MDPSDGRPRRRQARGERQIARILDVAADLFAEVGFEAASTNAIAARAGISPGSLYQYFSGKDAIAEALARGFAERLRSTRAADDPAGIAALPLSEVVDRLLDPLVEFYLAHPGLLALLTAPGRSSRLEAATRAFHGGVIERAEVLLAARAPSLPDATVRRTARVGVQLVWALLPLVNETDADERAAMIAELKAAELRYLAPVLDGAPAAGSPPTSGTSAVDLRR